MNPELIAKHELSMSVEQKDLIENLRKLTVAAFSLSSAYDTLKNSIGENEVDNTKLNNIRKNAIVNLTEDEKQVHLDEFANFRNYVIDAVKKNRESIFFIKNMVTEITELIDNIDELVTREVIPQKNNEERDLKINKLIDTYNELNQVTEMAENYSNFMKMYGGVQELGKGDGDKRTIDSWIEDQKVEIKKLKSGDWKLDLPSKHDPTKKYGEKKDDSSVTTLAIIIDKVDDEDVNLTISEYAVLYEMPQTQKYVSAKTIFNRMDTRKNEDTFTFTDQDENEHTVHWKKSAI